MYRLKPAAGGRPRGPLFPAGGLACLASTRFQKYGLVFREHHSLTVMAPIRAARVSKRYFREDHSLTVAAPIRAARVSKRYFDTLVNF
jgi:hypothetical protein